MIILIPVLLHSIWRRFGGICDEHMALAEMEELGRAVPRCEEKVAHHYIEATNRMNYARQWEVVNFLISDSLLFRLSCNIKLASYARKKFECSLAEVERNKYQFMTKLK